MSLCTNVPLQETVQICADALYRGCLGPVSIPETLFFKFMHLATEGVEFRFEDIKYAQIVTVSMGSPLGPSFLLDIIRAYCLRNVRNLIFIHVILMTLFPCLIT